MTTDVYFIWYTPAELAAKFGKDRTTVFRWCQDGWILGQGFCLRQDITGHWFIGEKRNVANVAQHS
jgi:hypothetical protein